MMCAMKFRKELAYEADPDDVYEMLSDPDFREKVARAQEAVSVDVQVTTTSGGFSLMTDLEQNTKDLPAMAKKITGDTTRAVITEEWSSPDGGSITITAPGKPTNAAGTVTISAGPAGTTEVVELEVKVKVPLIGGKLEQLMADNIDAGYDVEHQVGQAWLAGER
jgi:carbon monoxide dehydrogenase subunit G